MRKSSFTIVNEKIKKGLKSTGGIKFKRNTGKANNLLSDFNQRKKVGVKSEADKEAEKLEKDARQKDAENLRLANFRVGNPGNLQEPSKNPWDPAKPGSKK